MGVGWLWRWGDLHCEMAFVGNSKIPVSSQRQFLSLTVSIDVNQARTFFCRPKQN